MPLFDSRTGVYWASDSFGSPVTHEVEDIDELDVAFWREGFLALQSWVSPWHRWLDPVRYGKHLDHLRGLGASAVASGHGVTLHGDQIASAFALLEELPHMAPAPLETQADLEAQMAAMMAASGDPVGVPAGRAA